MNKKIFLSIASVFLAYQSINVFSKIDALPIDSWPLIILLGWVLNMLVTGVFALSGFAWPTHKLLPDSYYEVANPKRLKQVYKFLKVEWFRKFLLVTIWKSKDNQKKFFDGKVSGLENFETQSQKSEFGHVIAFVLLLGAAVYLLVLEMDRLAFTLTVWNVFGNLYPVILQQYHRMRITVMRKRIGSRK